MSLRREWAIGFCLLAFLSVPRESAALFNWIHEMSGPTMVGFGYNCKILQPRPFDVDHHLAVSRRSQGADKEEQGSATARTRSLLGQDKCFWQGRQEFRSDERRSHYWVRLETAVLFSISHPADPDNRPRVWAFAPALMFEASPTHPAEGKVSVFAGIGIEGFVGFGHGMRRVVRPALKFRPLGLRVNELGPLKAVDVAFDAKYYAVRFTPEDFGRPNGIDDTRIGDEWVFGASLTLILPDFSL